MCKTLWRLAATCLGLALWAAPSLGLEIKNGSTAIKVNVLMISSTDHTSPLTGATLTVVKSKNGGAFAALSGSVAETANGWYAVTLAAGDVDTNGDLILHATATGADPSDRLVEIVAYDPTNATTLGLTNLDATVSSRSTYAGGAVASVTGNVGGNVVGSVASVTGNVGGNVVGSVGSVTGNVGGNVVGSVASVAGNVAGSTGSISGVTFPANFAALGITAGGKVSGVVLADTLTTYTGNTPQTGDAYARIGAAGSGLSQVSLATAPPTAAAIATAVLTDTASGDQSTAGSAGFVLKQLAAMVNGTPAFTAAALVNAPSGGSGGATAGQIATAVWQDLTSGADFTTSGSVGKALSAYVATVPVTGTVVAGSTGASYVVSGLPAGKSYVTQRLLDYAAGEARVIQSQSYAGGNYTFVFGGGTGMNAAFSSSPAAGVVVQTIP